MVQGEEKSRETWSSQCLPTRAHQRRHPVFEPERTQPPGLRGYSRELEAAGGFKALVLWLLSSLMAGCRKGGRRCWGGAGWLGATFCKWPQSVPALGLIIAGRSLQCWCPVHLIKPQMEEGELACRDTPRGSQRGYFPANSWLFASKAGPRPRWVRGGREAASAG